MRHHMPPWGAPDNEKDVLSHGSGTLPTVDLARLFLSELLQMLQWKSTKVWQSTPQQWLQVPSVPGMFWLFLVMRVTHGPETHESTRRGWLLEVYTSVGQQEARLSSRGESYSTHRLVSELRAGYSPAPLTTRPYGLCHIAFLLHPPLFSGATRS